MDALHFDTFGELPEDDMSEISVVSRSEVDWYYIYPDGFNPCKKCKQRKQGSPLCRKCWLASLQFQRENDDEKLLALVTQGTHSALSSSTSKNGQQSEDYESVSPKLRESEIGVQSWLAQLDEADTCVDLQWKNGQDFANTPIRVCIDSCCPCSGSCSSSSWNDERAWTPRTCDSRSTDNHTSQASTDDSSSDSDRTPSSSDYDYLEAARHDGYVMMPRVEFFRLWALQNNLDGDKAKMEIEPSIGDVWYVTRRWLVIKIRRVTDTPRRWLALIINWIRRAYSRMRSVLGIRTRPNEQQDEEVLWDERWDEP
ncbi:hypothetical protein F4679DRAFT_595899 [Xylaria curta]|nr:hypothetical protein F4679DRAFT_595899 [Xylaria curta]